MPHSQEELAIRRGLLRRQVELLEKIADEAGADVESLEQCRKCGGWFKSVSSHIHHCDGPEI